MADPVVTIEIAFASNPLATSPTWVDASSYVLEWSVRRGRERALDRVQAGTAMLRLDNADRRFDPTNTASPYYPNVIPTRPIRIRATYSGTTYNIFRGTINEWPLSWDSPLDGEITVDCTDGFKYFNRATYVTTLFSDTSANVVYNALSGISWPVADRDMVSTNNQTWIQEFAPGQNILTLLQSVAEAEGGTLFIDGRGYVVFHDRHHRLLNSLTPIATFGFGEGELPYSLPVPPDVAEDLIYNDVRITPTGGAEQVASDSASQTAYFRRTYSRTLPIEDNGSTGASAATEALSRAQWLLYTNKDPQFRFRSIAISGHSGDALWPIELGGEISDRIRMNWAPPSGATITRDCYIEALEHHVRGGTWTTRWALSPADTGGWWVMDVGALDSTTRLAY